MTMKINPKFKNFLLKRKKRINDLLGRYLQNATQDGPKNLSRAIKYVVLNGGKRLRSLLVYAVGDAYGANLRFLDAPAAAIELIHSFSLVHDDLPAMDNDSLRRGKPTCHLAFDEATAILAGDTLAILAFWVLYNDKVLPSSKKVEMGMVLAKASGPGGIAGGQYIDLHPPKKPTRSGLERMYLLKTGSLISAAIKLGALAAGVNKRDLRILEQFALNLGIVFQIKDDILNIEGRVKRLGKNVGTDSAQNKITYPMLVGMPKAKMRMEELCRESYGLLRRLKIEDSFLGFLIDFVIQRDF